MSRKLLRTIAITLLCEKELTSLTKDEKEILLLDWWKIDESTPEFLDLPETLKKEIQGTEIPTNVQNSLYNPLLLVALEHKYRGVRNEYLSNCLKAEGFGDFLIEGELETLLECPCCHYLTLDSRGQYDICPVCFWEDTGDINPGQYSSPNRMTLSEARDKFSHFGAISWDAKKFIDPEGTEKWIRVR